jgi:hypothetical protein
MFLTSFVLIMALATVTGADWVAYNDLQDGNGGTAALGLNVTTHTYLDTNMALMNFDTGATLTVTMTGEIVGDGDANGDAWPNNGGNCDAGTDADNIFGGILDLTGGNELDSTAEHKAIIFNGLNPGMSYTITLTQNRANPGYTNRWSKVTIEGADAYTYAASAGVKKFSEASGEFCVGHNTVTGYVMKWTDISCGADGSFSIKTENADHGGKGYAMSAFKLEEYSLTSAAEPSPADGATDVPREVVLSWTPGMFAPPINGHKVFLSENFDDVKDGIGGITQSAVSYDPGRLDWGTTYYWRVDEVNGAPDYTVYEGEVWSFTTEPFAYPIGNITTTASSSSLAKGPENTINGSGLDDSGLLHSKEGDDTMWLSDIAGPQPNWIEFQFDNVYKLYELWVWNSNEFLEPMVGLGFKDVTIEYSVNGTDYTTLGTTHQFARAPGESDYAHNTTVDLSGVRAKYVRLTANSNWGGILPQSGLSEVRIFYVPVQAREPRPADGETDVSIGTIDALADVTLDWRAGREAAKHDVYVSTDEQAVADGTAGATTVAEASYGLLSLDLGKTYYWRVDEVNEAETPSMWQGAVWNFRAQDYFVVDDFESYNDLDPGDLESNRIFNAWIDGYGIATNGSLVGYENPPFCERTIVHSGKQSMPLTYSNTAGAAYSEAERTFAVGQNWTQAGAATLVLYFHGAEGNMGQLYVKVDGSKVVYGGDAGDIAKAEWKQWSIDLASLGAGLQNVTKLSVGIDGNGATGTLYFDDIRLYPLP